MMIEEGNDALNQSLPTTTMTPLQKKSKNKNGRELRRSVTCLEPATTERLQIVDLSNMCLNALPNPSLSLTSICKLDLSNNNLQNIPESLTARLLNLIVLDVRSNQLRTIPNSIGCLTKLKTLNVSGNFLESLPKTIENCRLLEELNANFNKLKILPDTMGYELTNLKKLSVNSNKLIFLPNSITHMTSLRVLDARLNCLHSLPDDLENLINLEILNVSQNFQYLSSLPFSLGLLISLVELDISYNRITVLPHSLGCLRKLQKLSVEGNPLVSPPKEVMEQSLYSVKEYLSEKMNSAAENKSPSKKKAWGGFGKFVKWRTFNAREGREEGGEGYAMSDYRQIEGLASPRYMSALSPRRLFSPRRNYFSP